MVASSYVPGATRPQNFHYIFGRYGGNSVTASNGRAVFELRVT